MEIWKDVIGYEGVYQVSNLGRVKSLPRKWIMKEKILKPYDKENYHTVCLSINQNRKRHYVHKLVAIAFLKHKPSGHELIVDHINEIKKDNRLSNLQIITHRENTIKYYKYLNESKKRNRR